jgi:hypothetical protein
MFEVYAAPWDADSCMDRSYIISSLPDAVVQYQELLDNTALMQGFGFDITLTDLDSDSELMSASVSPL